MTAMKNAAHHALTALIQLSQDELQRLPKPKEGFGKFIRPIIELLRTHRRELTVSDATPERLSEELLAYEELLRIERAAEQHLQAARSTRALRAASLWRAMLDIYALAKVVGRYDVSIERGIARFLAFMKQGPRSRQKATSP